MPCSLGITSSSVLLCQRDVSALFHWIEIIYQHVVGGFHLRFQLPWGRGLWHLFTLELLNTNSSTDRQHLLRIIDGIYLKLSVSYEVLFCFVDFCGSSDKGVTFRHERFPNAYPEWISFGCVCFTNLSYRLELYAHFVLRAGRVFYYGLFVVHWPILVTWFPQCIFWCNIQLHIWLWDDRIYLLFS